MLSLIAVLPFYSVYLAHFLLNADATGFIQGDQPYYVANGREIFERGNGFAHPNPYEIDPQAPVIYFHWLTWLYGASVKILGTDPAFFPLASGAIAGIAFGWITLRLIEALLPDRRFVVPLFFLAMWGGGLLCLAGILFPAPTATTVAEKLLSYDPTDGWWFLNWGRNVMYPVESVYHVIVAATWLAILRGHENRALLGGLLLATTHPFSGLQLLLFLGGWFTYRVSVLRSGAAWIRLGISLLMLAIFLYYYIVFLNQFPQHRAIELIWASAPFDTVLKVPTMLLAYGPVAVLAGWRLFTEPRPWKGEVILFAGCFCVTLFLIKHELLIQPHKQPIHFSHGYEWMPLFLLGLPKLQQLLIAAGNHLQVISRVALMAGLFGLATFDNLSFIVIHWTSTNPVPLFLTSSEREMLTWMDQQQMKGVLLTTDWSLGYAASTYTTVTPYAGHVFNTPGINERMRQIEEYFSTMQPAPWLDQVDYFLVQKKVIRVPKAAQSDWLPDNHWKKIRENEGCLLLARIRPTQDKK